MRFKTPASVYTRRRNSKSVSSAAILALAVLAAAALVVGAQHPSVTLADGGGGNGLASLKTVAVPRPANLARFIKDEQAAIALGKALFWDQQVGSDGQSCASCHFHAGADSRSKNQIDPGLRAVPPDPTLQLGGPNWRVGSGGTARNPGSIWFFDRLSAPAWKWQLAQDWPSLPTCWSQNRALPRAMAACSSLMNRARLAGRGMATVLSEARPLPPPPSASVTEGCCAPTTNAAAARTARAKIAAELTDLLLRLRV